MLNLTRGIVPKRWPLCEGVALAVPVLQAPLGSFDGPRLAAEVSRAGALGCLSLFDPIPAAAGRRVGRVRARTPCPFLVALTAEFEPDLVLDACLAAGARLFHVFWWNGPRIASRVHAAGGKVFWQVGTAEQALDAAEFGADVLVAQGAEAGGQVRGAAPLRELVPQVADATGLPVVGCGGLADRDDVARVLALGARAAMLGTRFVASSESRATPAYKARLVRAGAEDLYLDTRIFGSWPCAPHRCIRTGIPGGLPAFFAGKGIGRIQDISPAAAIVRALNPCL